MRPGDDGEVPDLLQGPRRRGDGAQEHRDVQVCPRPVPGDGLRHECSGPWGHGDVIRLGRHAPRPIHLNQRLRPSSRLLGVLPEGRIAEGLAWFDLSADPAEDKGVVLERRREDEPVIPVPRDARGAEPVSPGPQSFLDHHRLTGHLPPPGSSERWYRPEEPSVP